MNSLSIPAVKFPSLLQNIFLKTPMVDLSIVSGYSLCPAWA